LVAGSVKNGGAERSASLICYYFNKVKIFKLFLFTFKKKEKNEFSINGNIQRIIIKHNLIEVIKQKKIDILLYQKYNYRQIEELNKINCYLINMISKILLHFGYKKVKKFKNNYYKSFLLSSLDIL
jgi:hypothetical protein